MGISFFCDGANIIKIDELFTSIGLIVSTKIILCEYYQKLKPHIMDLSKIELRQHCSKVIGVKDYRGDILFEKNI